MIIFLNLYFLLVLNDFYVIIEVKGEEMDSAYLGLGEKKSIMGSAGVAAYGWMIAAVILSIVGAILVLVLFVGKKNKSKFKGFAKWLYTTLNFDNYLIEYIIKFIYYFATIFVILGSFAFIGTNFLMFFLQLLLGPIFVRLIFESMMLYIKLVSNTTEIKNQLEEKREKK